ncbi:hypothetical protein KHA80_19975 [Anaerobacillus sp. HL2]|nr:hypothetical protein KHA80_19975 [Anaerobacillus sp. HL2]
MSDEKLIRKERFQLLLQQILFPDDLTAIFSKNALIHKLSIYKNEKKWQFDLNLKGRLSQVFQLFLMIKLNKPFIILQMLLTIRYSKGIVDNEAMKATGHILLNPWKAFSPSIIELLKNKHLIFKVISLRLQFETRLKQPH